MAFSLATYFFGGPSPNYDPIVDCMFCVETILASEMEKHLEKKHKCTYCTESDYMNVESLQIHVEEKHMVSCKLCSAKRFNDEIAQHELTHSVIGIVQLGKLTDERFNQLVAENRIYSKDGCLFIRDAEPMPRISDTKANDEIQITNQS